MKEEEKKMIPNMNPNLILVTADPGCEADGVFWAEAPIIGWLVTPDLLLDGINPTGQPVSVMQAAHWVIYDRASGRAWGPADECFKSMAEVQEWLIEQVRGK